MNVDTLADYIVAESVNKSLYIVTPNVRILNRMRKDSHYRESIEAASIRLNDSRVLERLAAFFGLNLPAVPGSDLTELLLSKLKGSQHKVVVVGSNSDDLEKIRAQYGFSLEGIHPPMGLADNPAACQELVQSLEKQEAHTILFCLGNPLAENIAYEVLGSRNLPGTLLCVGASIDFLSGAQRRAPLWFRAKGLEWLHRMLTNLVRLGPRYISDFFGLVLMLYLELKHRLVSR